VFTISVGGKVTAIEYLSISIARKAKKLEVGIAKINLVPFLFVGGSSLN
jgi:hypothetical protein